MISSCYSKKDHAFVLLGIEVIRQPMNVSTLMNANWPLMKNIDWPTVILNILSRCVTNQQSAPILSAVLNVNVRKVYLVMAYCHVMISMNVSRHVSSWDRKSRAILCIWELSLFWTSFSDWLGVPSNLHRIGNLTQQTHDCHPMADCINTDFSYQCQCKNGYFEDVGECFDADECVMKTHRKVSKPRSVALLFVRVTGHVVSLHCIIWNFK